MKKTLLIVVAFAITSTTFAGQNIKRTKVLRNIQATSASVNENMARGEQTQTQQSALDFNNLLKPTKTIQKTLTAGNVLIGWDFDNDPYGTIEGFAAWLVADFDEQPINGTNQPRGWYRAYEGNLYAAAPDNIVMASKSWFAAGAADVSNDDWLISPDVPIPTTSTYEVVWDARALQDAPFNDGYEVRIALADNLWNALDALPQTATTAEELSVFLANSTVKFTNTAAGESSRLWQTRKVDLTEYAGQTIVVMWRSNNYDKNLLFLDNIAIQEPQAYATTVTIDSLPAIFFYQQPTFVPALSYSSSPKVTVKSKGANAVTNTNVTLTQYKDYDYFAHEIIPFGTLAFNTEQTLIAANTYTITAGSGSHYFIANVVPDQQDGQSSVESKEFEIVLTTNTFATDNDDALAPLSVGPQNNNKYLGALYEFPVPVSITSVSFNLAQTTQTTAKVVIFAVNGTVLATSATVPVTATAANDEAGAWYTASFLTPLAAVPGTLYIIAVEEQPLKSLMLMRGSNAGAGVYSTVAAPTINDWGLYDDYSLFIRANVVEGSNGIDNNTYANVSAYGINNGIMLSGIESATPVRIYDAVGKLIVNTTVNANTTFNTGSGLYLVQTGSKTEKVLVK
jgi:hypothetical protein